MGSKTRQNALEVPGILKPPFSVSADFLGRDAMAIIEAFAHPFFHRQFIHALHLHRLVMRDASET
jgi:hypothetical protein